MTYRDPKSPPSRRGDGSRGETSGRGQVRRPDESVPIVGSPSPRPPAAGRRAMNPEPTSRTVAPRSRPAVPTPTSRAAGDPFAEPVFGTRRASTAPDRDREAGSGRSGRAAPTRSAADDPTDPTAWSDVAADWIEPGGGEWEELPAAAPARQPAPSRRRPRETVRARPPRARPAIDFSNVRLPGAAGQSTLLGDRVSGLLIGVNLLSLIAMVIRLGTQLGQLPPSLVVHFDAAGLPDLWGTPAVLWRLPLIAGGSFLMSLVVAWFGAPIDRFAARFALAAALGVQLFVWVAVLDLV